MWLDRWAFGTSPHGLALDAWEFWALSHREVRALRKVWEMERKFTFNAIAALRSDIHNSSEMMQRRDKKRWTPQDFGAKEVSPQAEAPRFRKFTPQEFKEHVISQFGPDGRGKQASGMSIVKSLKGTGQLGPPPAPKTKKVG